MKRQGILIIGLMLMLTACKGTDLLPAGVGPVPGTEDSEAANDGNKTGAGESGDQQELNHPEGAAGWWKGGTGQESAGRDAEAEKTGMSGLPARGTKAQEAGYEGLLEQAGWGQYSCHLEDVEALLSRRGLACEKQGNVSGERLDMTWEDGTKLMFLATADDMGRAMGMELMMVDGQLNGSGFQENYLNEYDVTVDQEYYPQTANRLLEAAELGNMNQTDLSIARNEIFARHGRRFEDPFLRAVFERKSWYWPQYDGDQFSSLQSGLLNTYEKENIKKIVEYEQSKGYRAAKG